MVWSCVPFTRSGQSHLARHSKRGRRQGRQKNRWEDNIREWTGLEFGRSRGAVENREKWRKLVAKSSVVHQRPSRLRDRWWRWVIYIWDIICLLYLLNLIFTSLFQPYIDVWREQPIGLSTWRICHYCLIVVRATWSFDRSAVILFLFDRSAVTLFLFDRNAVTLFLLIVVRSLCSCLIVVRSPCSCLIVVRSPCSCLIVERSPCSCLTLVR